VSAGAGDADSADGVAGKRTLPVIAAVYRDVHAYAYRVRIATLVIVLLLVALLAGNARAGGTQVNVVAVAGRVWVTTGSQIVELDAITRRVLYRIKTRYPYPIDLGVSDGAVWASSVANGFVSGAVTRAPFDSSATTQPLVLAHRPILGLAVGSGTTWALVGPWSSLRLAAIDQASGRVRLSRLGQTLAWIAADNTGRTSGLYGLTRHGRLVRMAAGGNVDWLSATRGAVTPPAVASGSVWVASRTYLYRVDARTGRTRARGGIIGSPIQLVAGGGSLWVLSAQGTAGARHYELTKYDGRMRVIAHRHVGEFADSIAFGNTSVWIGRSRPNVSVIRVNSQSLRLTVFAQALR
jgi:hypothetical protein